MHCFDPALLRPISIRPRDARIGAIFKKIGAPGDYAVLVHPSTATLRLDSLIALALPTAHGDK